MDPTATHLPVLRQEVLDLLAPSGRCTLLDCTIGLGGHAEAWLETAGTDATLIGLDLDESNLRVAHERLARFSPRVRLFHASFSEARGVLDEAGVSHVERLLADLGVASSQLDDPRRGLSFTADGPLDMRLDPSVATTAADLVNQLSQTDLADLIYQLGQERYSRRIARAIVEARQVEPVRRTQRLAEIVTRAYPPAARKHRRGVHPATRTFMALRIAVNEELSRLEHLLAALPELLTPGARAAIISFHSLEDGPVKRAFAQLEKDGRARRLTKKPIVAGEDETRANPRSRSAKLRAMEWIS